MKKTIAKITLLLFVLGCLGTSVIAQNQQASAEGCFMEELPQNHNKLCVGWQFGQPNSGKCVYTPYYDEWCTPW